MVLGGEPIGPTVQGQERASESAAECAQGARPCAPKLKHLPSVQRDCSWVEPCCHL